MVLVQNILNNFSELQADFIHVSVSLAGITQFLLHIFIALAIFVLFYFFGERVRRIFFKENNQFSFFVSIALGYILIGTGLGILGLLSLLTPVVVLTYFILLGIFAFWGLSLSFRTRFGISFVKMLKQVQHDRNVYAKSFFVWGVVLFVFITFLRLMTPEIVEDGYHTDNAKLFVMSQTTMIPSKEALHTIPFPQLPEMIYMIPLFFGDREAARFIHFGFYVLIIALLFTFAREKQYHFAAFLPLLFVTTPTVIRNSPAQHTDFFAVFCFLLLLFLIEKKRYAKNIFLIGLLFGAVVSAKVWMLVYLSAVLLYLLILNFGRSVLHFMQNKKTKRTVTLLKQIVMAVFIFVTGYLAVCSIWYIRAYLLTGNPIFPILNAVFIPYDQMMINPIPYEVASQYIGFNIGMFLPQNLAGLSPFFFFAVVSFLLILRTDVKPLVKTPLLLFFVIFMIEQLFVRIEWGRYLLMWSLITGTFFTYGIVVLYQKSKLYRYSLVALFFVIFSYYFLNTLLALPYGFGWADKNAYLTRILSRDNASYYDFDRLFDKHISKKDIVATYRYVSFYHTHFRYVDVGYILDKKGDSFTTLQKHGVTKLAIMGGDITWFCKELRLSDCDVSKVKLLASYPDFKKYNLYELK